MNTEQEHIVEGRFVRDKDIPHCMQLISKSSRDSVAPCFSSNFVRRSSRLSQSVDGFSKIRNDETEMKSPNILLRKAQLPKADSSLEDSQHELSKFRSFNSGILTRRSQKIELINVTDEKKSLRRSRFPPDYSEFIIESHSETPKKKLRKSQTSNKSFSVSRSSSSELEDESKPVNVRHVKTEFKPRKCENTRTPCRKSTLLSTPKSSKLSNSEQLRTPAVLRRKLTKKFANINRKKESDEESSSSNDLEYSSDDCFGSSETESVDETDEDECFQEGKSNQRSPLSERIAKLNLCTFSKKKIADVDFDYDVDADNYFVSTCSKDPTSNNKLSSLEVSHLEEDEIENLLQNQYAKHKTDILLWNYKNEFPKWLFYLRENFNLLLYGLGSKIELLEYFHSEMLSTHDVLTVHGYFPRLFVKDILNSLIADILKINAPKNVNEALPVIYSALKSRKSPVFLIIHNIDRLFIRQRKYQSILSKLASFPNMHVIVSIDHINAPLLWGNSLLNELNFVWIRVSSYQPYINETSFENLIYLTETSSDFVSLSSLRNIIKPLAVRVKKIFRIIAKARLDNANNKQYKGMSYDEWYHRSKEELLVNNGLMFQVQLTELIDHGIIRMNDRQCIPVLVKLDVLEKFYKEMSENEED